MQRKPAKRSTNQQKNLKINPKKISVKPQTEEQPFISSSKSFIRVKKNFDTSNKSDKELNSKKEQLPSKIIIVENEDEHQKSSIKFSTIESSTKIKKKNSILSKTHHKKIPKSPLTQKDALKINKDIDFDFEGFESEELDKVLEVSNANIGNNKEEHILKKGSTMDYFNLNKLKLKTFVDMIDDSNKNINKGNLKKDMSLGQTLDVMENLIDDENEIGRCLIDLDSNFKKWWDIFNALLIVK